ncbi:hypothetical protein NF212_16255 [Parasalinivibrio latis]|uniref:hypothetical protein n=1 Tax=Parasalinivibrio latis TaxID=2952610 RepID=UPI0030E571AE
MNTLKYIRITSPKKMIARSQRRSAKTTATRASTGTTLQTGISIFADTFTIELGNKTKDYHMTKNWILSWRYDHAAHVKRTGETHLERWRSVEREQLSRIIAANSFTNSVKSLVTEIKRTLL